MKTTITKTILIMAVSAAHAENVPEFSHAPQCQVHQEQLNNINEGFKQQYDNYNDESEEVKDKSDDCGAWIKGDITWDITTMRFGTPSVTMKTQEWKFHVPQVTMKNERMSFDFVSTYMAPTKTGQYPEIYCTKHLIPKCTVKWSDIITYLPQFKTERKEIVIGIPHFKWEITSVKLDVPEFFIQQQEWKMHLPQFTATDGFIGCGEEVKNRSENLQSGISSTRSAQIKQSSAAMAGMFGCLRDDLMAKKAEVANKFNGSIMQMNQSIEAVKAAGADPTKLKDQSGKDVNLVANRDELLVKQTESLESFDNAISQLNEQEKKAIEKMTGSSV
ncbi:hypothetical protein D515_02995 [Grimontia indica]|uniref:Uncharacterized protein n=1 Tax=Grimontia indica TaxID=1056512 RepID=R1GPQ7_9GAMM|nr:hypothetical protein [Grimontia indica]EOD78213.1 hypothetical protein D515_02995 [Grimontia indica]